MQSKFFIALLPPESIQAEVIQIQNHFRDRYGIKPALKVAPHVTLIAPFNLDSDRLESLQIELEKFVQSRSIFMISFSGFAAFAPRVIYIDVVPNSTLHNLYQDISDVLSTNLSIVDPYADRPFVPHMTVGFLDLTPENFELAWTELRDRQISFEFEAIALTLLVHDQQKWNVLSDFNFSLNQI